MQLWIIIFGTEVVFQYIYVFQLEEGVHKLPNEIKVRMVCI